MDNRKISLSYKKPIFVQNREAVKQIEMLTESIPQLILQIYIFQKKNDIFNVFSSPTIFYVSQQIGSIITSMFSIIFGLISIYGYKAFYYYEKKKIWLGKIIRMEKKDKKRRFLHLMNWYLTVVIQRIFLILNMLIYNQYLILLFIFFILLKSLILSKFEKKYFEQKKYKKEFEKDKQYSDLLSHREYDQNTIQNMIYFKPKSVLKSILAVLNMIIGVYDNILIDIEYHSNAFFIPRQTKNYLIFYLLFYIENVLLATYIYYGFNNNDLSFIFFCVFSFPISVLIQILNRRAEKGEKVSFLFLSFYDKTEKILIYI